jgi:uncharacterized membrane protein
MRTGKGVSPQRLANGLGWFSIGLGLAELTTPKFIAKLIGVSDSRKARTVLRLYGARELAAGIGILSNRNPSGWVWARVAGDVADLSSLGKAVASSGNGIGRAAAATAAVAGVTVADIGCAMALTKAQKDGRGRTERAAIASSIVIAREPSEIYEFWRGLNRLPEIFDRLESVEALDGNRSHWKLALPAGRSLEWDAEITADEPNARIAWRSLPGSAPHVGEVRFEPATGRRGTKVTVKIGSGHLNGRLGRLVGFVPEQQVNIALHNLKQLLETGEVIKSDASVHRGMHAAQPAELKLGAS